jgi:hypothetical protein
LDVDPIDENYMFNDDMKYITKQINDYYENKVLKDIIDKFNRNIYNFDKVHLNKLKLMSKQDIIKDIHNIAKKIILQIPADEIYAKLKNKEFGNILTNCYNHQSLYCSGSKLIVPIERYNALVEILASDILNPFKQKFLFDIIFADNVINYMKFIKRKHESVVIEILFNIQQF